MALPRLPFFRAICIASTAILLISLSAQAERPVPQPAAADAQEESGQPAATDNARDVEAGPSESEIKALIKQLNANQFSKRQSASQ